MSYQVRTAWGSSRVQKALLVTSKHFTIYLKVYVDKHFLRTRRLYLLGCYVKTVVHNKLGSTETGLPETKIRIILMTVIMFWFYRERSSSHNS